MKNGTALPRVSPVSSSAKTHRRIIFRLLLPSSYDFGRQGKNGTLPFPQDESRLFVLFCVRRNSRRYPLRCRYDSLQNGWKQFASDQNVRDLAAPALALHAREVKRPSFLEALGQ
jgi:hypothetical protein